MLGKNTLKISVNTGNFTKSKILFQALLTIVFLNRIVKNAWKRIFLLIKLPVLTSIFKVLFLIIIILARKMLLTLLTVEQRF